METILYVGGFELPDRNAAAHRVIGIAKGLKAIGKQVIFLNYTTEQQMGWTEHAGFLCYQAKKQSMYKQLTDIEDAKRIIAEKNVTGVIAYNYPAIALARLIHWCHAHGVRCYADATEWYVAQGNLVYKTIKTIDTECRMRWLHKKMDGVIAISEYLYQYYEKSVRTVKIPATVDIADAKWNTPRAVETEKTRFVYAGSPSAQKERLDLIVEAIEKVAQHQGVALQIVGITKAQYEAIYGRPYVGEAVTFAGRLSHLEAIEQTRQADWMIIIRDNNKVVQAGFPTKLVESIACGTPVIANRFSNIEDYLTEENSILCASEEIEQAIEKACGNKKRADHSLFDYHHYVRELAMLWT